MISGGAPCIELCACRFNGDRPRAAMGAVPVCYHYLSSLIVNTTNTMIIILSYCIVNTMLLSMLLSIIVVVDLQVTLFPLHDDGEERGRHGLQWLRGHWAVIIKIKPYYICINLTLY